jgi:peptidoglycan biosynthesis protein MviN/MurJ (putative lipid II flippase)
MAFTAHAFMLYMVLNRRARSEQNEIHPTELLGRVGRIALAGAALLAALWAFDGSLGMRLADTLFLRRVLRMVLGSAVGIGAYLAAARLVGLEEVSHLLSRWKES